MGNFWRSSSFLANLSDMSPRIFQIWSWHRHVIFFSGFSYYHFIFSFFYRVRGSLMSEVRNDFSSLVVDFPSFPAHMVCSQKFFFFFFWSFALAHAFARKFMRFGGQAFVQFKITFRVRSLSLRNLLACKAS